MPSFDIADVFHTVNAITLIAALVVGVQGGFFYAYHAGLGVRAFHTMMMFSMFFLTLAIVRWFQLSDTWENWIGIWMLSILFGIGQSVGYTLRIRYERFSIRRKNGRFR